MEIKVVQNVLEKNKRVADLVRKKLEEKKWSLFNFMSSPGSGKTSLLEKLIPELTNENFKVGVIEGDVATLNDSIRLQKLDIPISHITTEKFGGSCHLAANVILEALGLLEESEINSVFIENVGNLICPAEYDTGADKNICLISTTEGEDKPLKYPGMFRKSHLAIINKIDIAEVLETDISLLKNNILQINPEIDLILTSAKTGEGVSELKEWIIKQHGTSPQTGNSRSGHTQ